jgi:uracil-DNA glycosylase family 4
LNAKSNDHWSELENAITGCEMCSRLVAWREAVAREKKRAYRDCDYWGKGVPGFGDRDARVLVLGLAPGAHGSNRTGRMFTGDSSGKFLYPALFRAGFSNREYSESCEDDLCLTDLFITAVCRCAPPGNKPSPEEIIHCRGYLQQEFEMLPHLEGIVALGQIAFHEAGIHFKSRGADPSMFKFGHGILNRPADGLPWLLGSYHPSRQNTQTGRLTVEMFDKIWQNARDLLNGNPQDEISGR